MTHNPYSEVALYRHFGENKRLLYVGISQDVGSRTRQHEQAKWWLLVESMTVERFPSRAEALTAEAAAIRSERPAYNIQGRTGHRRPVETTAGQEFESLVSAATRLGVSTKTVRRWIAAGRLTGYRVGPTLIRLNPAEVDRLASAIPTAMAS